MASNPDRRELRIAERAARERWTLGEFLAELQKARRLDYDPSKESPTSTDEVPGTLEKILVMAARVAAKRSPFHHADPFFDDQLGIAMIATNNRNGRLTEFEAVQCQGEVDDEVEPAEDYDAIAREWVQKALDRLRPQEGSKVA